MLSACGFSSPASNPGGGGGDDGPSPDASIDTPEPEAEVNLPLYAASNQMIYKLDVDQKTSMLIGPVKTSGGTSVSIDGLALFGHTLIGLSDGGAELISIEKDTGSILTTTPLTPENSWGGLTVIPAGELEATPVVLSGMASDGKLYRIDPSTGAVTAVGPFTGSMRFFSDLAWIKGQGLFATLTGGTCADVCFARLDPTTGAATVFRSNLGTNLFGLSGYRGKLWAFNNAGPVLTVNITTGLMTMAFDPEVPWTEAAQ
jgi:hypothetical protein